MHNDTPRLAAIAVKGRKLTREQRVQRVLDAMMEYTKHLADQHGIILANVHLSLFDPMEMRAYEAAYTARPPTP